MTHFDQFMAICSGAAGLVFGIGGPLVILYALSAGIKAAYEYADVRREYEWKAFREFESMMKVKRNAELWRLFIDSHRGLNQR